MESLLGVAESPQADSSITSIHKTRVFVIESQVLMAKALCHILAQDDTICVVGDAIEVQASRLRTSSPHLILLDSDTNLDRLSDTIGMCRMASPNARIAVLSGHLSADVMQQVLSAGADGFIVKDITPDGLLAAVKTMIDGSLYVDPRLVGSILRKHAGIGRRDPNELSPRELEIVRLIAGGLSNREISARLMLSDKTIKNHISHIFAKLNVTARTQVVIYAMRTGLV
jgi:DNA-binding NarL/FixJ family response regulator